VRKRYLNQKMNVVFLTEQEFQYQKIQQEAPAAEETTETTNP
jgi:hypothetical protein